MNILITGTSTGIGLATAKLFLAKNHVVFGIDVNGQHESIPEGSLYSHHVADISDYSSLPDLPEIDIIINNAGVQNSGRDIEINLKGTINVCEKYISANAIKSVVNIASTSAHNGAEFVEYAASKGGMLTYTKTLAAELAGFNATCNSISPGGVITEMNRHILDDSDLYGQCLDETLLHKWATAEEIAQWIYFVAVVNRSMTGQDIIIDNGELSKFNFIW